MDKKLKRRIFDIIQIGNREDFISRFFDFFITIAILLNLFSVFFETFDQSAPYKGILTIIEWITVIIFTIEYVLRLWTAEYLFPEIKTAKTPIRFIFSFDGIVDLISFLPFYLPFFFPAGAVAFRMFRVVRIFRLFQVNSSSDAFNVIVDVIKGKANQLISSVFIICVLLLGSSLCMYSLEHEAQPEAFKNAFSGLWWTVSTMTTVGYGDIYPITTLGQIFGIFITFLGVGLVAVPTGILSAGFVEQYTEAANAKTDNLDFDMQFISFDITKNHPWIGKKVKNLGLPPGVILAIIHRNNDNIIPRGNIEICENDHLIIGAKRVDSDVDITLKEVTITPDHSWKDTLIRDLDISRQTLLVMVRRDNQNLIPDGSMRIHEGDKVLVYQKNKNIAL